MGRPAKITDADILLTARRLFLAEGPALPTAAIARALGISQATLFNRFGSKRALLIESLRPREDPTLMALLVEGPDARPLPEQLRLIGRLIADQCVEVDPAVSMLRAAGLGRADLFPGHEPSPMRRVQDAMVAWLRRAQQAGLAGPVDPAVAAALFLGALHSRPFDPAPPLDRLDAVIDALWLGLAPRAQARP